LPYQKAKSVKIGEEIVRWLMDISKYVMTGIVIGSFFTDLNKTWMIYTFGSFISALAFCLAVWLAKKLNNNNEN